MIEMKCPHCGHQLRIPEKYAGQQGVCKACQGILLATAPPAPGIPGAVSPEPASTALDDLVERAPAAPGPAITPAAPATPPPAAAPEGGEAHKHLGCLFWGAIFNVPIVSIVLAVLLPKGHPGKGKALLTSCLMTAFFLLLVVMMVLMKAGLNAAASEVAF